MILASVLTEKLGKRVKFHLRCSTTTKAQPRSSLFWQWFECDVTRQIYWEIFALGARPPPLTLIPGIGLGRG